MARRVPATRCSLLQAGSEFFGRNPALSSLELSMHRPHPFLETGVARDRARYQATLRRAARHRRLFVVVAPVPGVPESVLREHLGPRFRLISEHSFDGFAPNSSRGVRAHMSVTQGPVANKRAAQAPRPRAAGSWPCSRPSR